jgi:signal transduction histidine kinase
MPLTVGVTLLVLAQVPYPFVFLAMPLLLAAMVAEMAAALLLTLVASVAVAGAIATGVFVAPPLRAAWEQVYVYLALAASLVPAQLLASARAELHDIHERLAARSYELRRANDGLEQFVRIASHDLREPLNTVVQFGQLLEQDVGPRLLPEGRQYLGLMLTAARRMRGLLDDVLQYVRLQRHPLVEPQTVALTPLFQELRASLAGRLHASGAHLHIDALPAVQGNPTMLSLLFQNLLSNALKFVPPGRSPQVHVVARVEHRMAWITVVDNGIGIEAENLPKLFQPFQRLQLRRLYEGTGLGLALARQIAEAHGGEIVVASVPGEGSRFSVRLPRA